MDLKKYSLADSGKAAEAWTGWLENLESIDVEDNNILFNIAEGNSLEWTNLLNLNVNHTGIGTRGKLSYNHTVGANNQVAFDILNANMLEKIRAYNAAWKGKIFSIKNAKALKELKVSKIDWEGYGDGNGNEYLLPSNFVDNASDPSDHCALQEFHIKELIDGAKKELQFRHDEFEKMSNVVEISVYKSYLFGVFPSFNSTNDNAIIADLRASRFYDLENLGTSKNTRFKLINASSQGISRGGALLPSFNSETANNTSKLNYINFSNSLLPKFPSNWEDDTSKRGAVCFEAMYAANGTPDSYGHNNPL